MLCPACNTKLKTVNSRANTTGLRTWRRKRCQKCDLSLTSKEVLDLAPLISNKSFNYSRTELHTTLLKICSKSNQEFIDNIIDSIEINLIKLSKNSPVDSKNYTNTIFEVLKKLDQPANLRYQANLADI